MEMDVRVRAVLIVTVALVAIGGGVGVAIASTGDDAVPSAVTRPHGSYCDAARDALQYEGNDRAWQANLLDRTLALSPPELVSTMKTIRTSDPTSKKYTAAHRMWDYYNNNHCCQCIDTHYAPQLYELTPEQRKHIEQGKPL